MGEPTEAEKVAELIANEPWQEIVGPPRKKKSGGWLIPAKHGVFATWPHVEIPHVHSIYIKREESGWHVACIYDVHGKLHHR
jgi:hypothetical protein